MVNLVVLVVVDLVQTTVDPAVQHHLNQFPPILLLMEMVEEMEVVLLHKPVPAVVEALVVLVEVEVVHLEGQADQVYKYQQHSKIQHHPHQVLLAVD
jgi:hypothetical protein